jgi:hypothetical protein
MITYWHLRITIETSAKHRAEELAKSERRSAANYVGGLIEKDMREKETAGIRHLLRDVDWSKETT